MYRQGVHIARPRHAWFGRLRVVVGIAALSAVRAPRHSHHDAGFGVVVHWYSKAVRTYRRARHKYGDVDVAANQMVFVQPCVGADLIMEDASCRRQLPACLRCCRGHTAECR